MEAYPCCDLFDPIYFRECKRAGRGAKSRNITTYGYIGPDGNVTRQETGYVVLEDEANHLETTKGGMFLCAYRDDPASEDGRIPAGAGLYYISGSLTFDTETWYVVSVRGKISKDLCPTIGPVL
jgi:hypothetical protein